MSQESEWEKTKVKIYKKLSLCLANSLVSPATAGCLCG